MQVGSMLLQACGVLKRVAPYSMTGEDGKQISGHSGQIDYMGGSLKFGCDAQACHTLEQHLGKTIIIVGEPKIGGDKGKKPELKITRLASCSMDGKKLYVAAEDNSPAAAADPAAVEATRGGVMDSILGRKPTARAA